MGRAAGVRAAGCAGGRAHSAAWCRDGAVGGWGRGDDGQVKVVKVVKVVRVVKVVKKRRR